MKRIFLFVSSFVTVSPALVGLILWDRLPERLATHWNIRGEVDGYLPRAIAVFALPVFLLLIHFLSMWLTLREAKRTGQNPKVVAMVFWICPAMSWFLQGIIFGTAMGLVIDTARIFLVLLGVMFFVFGNYLPKCKMNGTIGVRIPWVYTSEENWGRTHRATGRLWVVLSLLFFAAVFLPEEGAAVFLLALFLIMALFPVVYSYRFYRKQVEKGEIPKRIPVKAGKGTKIVIICVLLLILLAFLPKILEFLSKA